MRRVASAWLAMACALALTPPFARGGDAAARRPTVRVDFSAERGPATQRASGFLHSITPTEPAEELVAPLRPRTFRMTPASSLTGGCDALSVGNRIQRLDASLQVIISDYFGYGRAPASNATAETWPGDGGDWTPWEDCIESLVRKSKAAPVAWQWDVWNEPDLADFWHPKGDRRARFFETWKRAYRKIKSLDPRAVIVGPSNVYYNNKAHYAIPGPFNVEDFLTFAKANDVLPDILSWHVWHEQDIVPTVRQARSFMKAHDIAISRISLNEIVHGDHQNDPGAQVWYFANAEEAGIDSACHACWPDANQCSSCQNATLCNLLTYPDRKPRATWWAYKAYADITGALVRAEGTADVAAIAGKDSSARTANILLGKKAGPRESLTVSLAGLDRMPWLKDGHGAVRLVLERIPATGWQPLSRPIPVRDEVVRFADAIDVSLPDFGPSEAFVVRLISPDSKPSASKG